MRCCNFDLLITSVFGLDGRCCLHVCWHIASDRVLPTTLLSWPLLLGSWQFRFFAIWLSRSASCYAAVRLRSAVAVLTSCGCYWTRSYGRCCFLDCGFYCLHAQSASQCSVSKLYFLACNVTDLSLQNMCVSHMPFQIMQLNQSIHAQSSIQRPGRTLCISWIGYLNSSLRSPHRSYTASTTQPDPDVQVASYLLWCLQMTTQISTLPLHNRLISNGHSIAVSCNLCHICRCIAYDIRIV